MKETPGAPESTQINTEYFDEYLALSTKARESREAAEESRIKATEAATATTKSGGLVWRISDKITELVEAGKTSGDEIAGQLKLYEAAVKDFEASKAISDPLIDDADKKSRASAQAHADFMEASRRLIPGNIGTEEIHS